MPEKNYNFFKLSSDGFTVIEALIGLTIFSLMFTALTAGIWSATSTLRVSSNADEAVINAQDFVEMLSVIEIDDVSGTDVTIQRENDQIVQYSILNPDATGDFKTIAISVYHSENNNVPEQGELKMRTYYRRRVY